MSREVLKLVRVRFPGQHRAGTFLSGRLELAHGQKVVAMSERGMAVGYVNSIPFEVPFTEDLRDLKYVSRIATTEDINKYKALYQRQRDTRTTFQQLASGHGLNVNLVDIEFTSFGKKAIFYFTGPERIDFRELIKSLSKVLKIQIELKQVPKGSSGLGEVGPCGEERCQFVNSLMENDPHNKRRCNEYYCLLEHKDPFYEDQRSRLPKVGDLIRTRSGDRGRVERLDLWNGEFEMITDQGVRRRYISTQWEETLDRRSIAFPKYFESIFDESKTVLGKEELNVRNASEREVELKNYQDAGKAFAESVFKSLFGE